MFRCRTNQKGFSLVESLLVAAIGTLVVVSLFAAFGKALQVLQAVRAQATALSVANDSMEYLRSLSYNDVGTISGFPAGNVPQNRVIVANGITFHQRVLIEYVDDDADGTDVSDSNGVITDYKRAKIELSWAGLNSTSSIAVTSNIVPRSIETNVGGGALRVNVFDAAVEALENIEVRLVNNTTTSTVDTTRYTDATGRALFIVEAAGNYEITATAPGYSTDQTYTASSSNPNPITSHIAVLEDDISTMNFQIDELSDLIIQTVSAINFGSFSESFTTSVNIASSSDISVATQELVLADSLGVYEDTGYAYTELYTPATIERWDQLSFAATSSASTTHLVRIYSGSSTDPVLIPDGDLPGNSFGFVTSPVDLSQLDVSTYPEIGVMVELATTDTAWTPQVDTLVLDYVSSYTPSANKSFGVTSNKSIGTDAGGQPVLKASTTFTTDASGLFALSDYEWDIYNFHLQSANEVEMFCGGNPYVLEPGVSERAVILLGPVTAHSLRVEVVDSNGDPIKNATVNLSRSGYSDSVDTNACGQAYFSSGVSSATDYTVEVIADGFITDTTTDFSIDGNGSVVITMSV